MVSNCSTRITTDLKIHRHCLSRMFTITSYLECLPSLLIWDVKLIIPIWNVMSINQIEFTLYITLITSNASSYKIPKIYLCGRIVSWGLWGIRDTCMYGSTILVLQSYKTKLRHLYTGIFSAETQISILHAFILLSFISAKKVSAVLVTTPHIWI